MPFPAPPPAPDRGSPQFAAQTEAFLDWLVAAYQGSETVTIEGAFTPTIVGTTVNGVGTYTVQNGRYSRIGRLVIFDILISWTAHTGTGNMQVEGLPFISINGSGRSALNIIAVNVSYTAAATLSARILQNVSSISIVQTPSGGGAISNVPIDTAGEFTISGSYAAQ